MKKKKSPAIEWPFCSTRKLINDKTARLLTQNPDFFLFDTTRKGTFAIEFLGLPLDMGQWIGPPFSSCIISKDAISRVSSIAGVVCPCSSFVLSGFSKLGLHFYDWLWIRAHHGTVPWDLQIRNIATACTKKVSLELQAGCVCSWGPLWEATTVGFYSFCWSLPQLLWILSFAHMYLESFYGMLQYGYKSNDAGPHATLSLWVPVFITASMMFFFSPISCFWTIYSTYIP